MKHLHIINNKAMLLCMALVLPGMLRAASVTVNVAPLRYTVDTEAMTAEVYGLINTSAIINDLVIPDFIEYEGSLIPVRSIRSYAFSNKTNLKGLLTIGNFVQSIGNNAFSGCSGLSGKLTIGNSLQTIGNSAFSECRGFTGSLTIPNSVLSIGDKAFYCCTGFSGSLTIGNSVQSIGSFAFSNCSGFTGSLTIPSSVQTIGEHGFSACKGFTGSLIIPNSIQTIETAVFMDCSGFNGSLTIPNTVQTIGSHAFFECSGFTGSLTIPNSVRSIGDRAFISCSGFTGSLIIPNSVQNIGDEAFSRCIGFSGTLTIGNSVQTIGEYAFKDCSNFTGILIIPESVKEINIHCFENCKNFSSLIIYSSNTIINYLAFAQCRFDSITSMGQTPPKCVYKYSYNYNFSASSYSKPLYVPNESIKLYKTATEWKKFTNIKPLQLSAAGITLDKKELELTVGQTETITATLTPEDASDEVIWTVDDAGKNIISVDQNGNITALAVGSTTVTATAGNVSAICKVIVKPVLASSVTLSAEDLTLLIGQTGKLTATVAPENVTDKTIVWGSDNEAVATVSADGTVTAVSVGTATITASATDGSGVSAECAVVVTEYSGIEDILTDKNAYVKIFNLSGVLIYEGIYSDANLVPDYYIVVCCGKNIKVKVK